MKILYITDIDFSSKDAPPIHVKEVVNNLHELKEDIFLIGIKEGDLGIKARTKYLRIPKVTILQSLFFNLKLFFILPFYIKKNKIDLIYTRQSGVLISPAIVSKIFSIPYVTEINGSIIDEAKSNRDNMFYLWVFKSVESFCYKSSDKIIAVTNKIKESITRRYNIYPNRIVILENGVDSEKFKPLNKNLCLKELKLDKHDYYIGYVGNFLSWQGIECLIEAIGIIKKSNPKVRCIIIGDGPERNNLEKLAKNLSIDKNIIFKGWVNHDLIPKYINSFYLCVAPKKKILSLGGASPFKMYEYASCGKPVISTKIPGTEFISKNKCGIIVEPNSPKKLAEAIIKLLKNPKLAGEMGKNGRKAILNGHSWKDVAKKTDDIIKEIIKK